MSERLFLDVERSANGMRWRHRLDPQQENVALAIAQQEGLPDLVARVLAGRGVAAGEAAEFLQPTVRSLLPDPASLTAMEEAAERLADAVSRGEQVAIFGDYDVDGAASSALSMLGEPPPRCRWATGGALAIAAAVTKASVRAPSSSPASLSSGS